MNTRFRRSDGRHRVVVTGVGVVAPCGIGADAFWSGLARDPEPNPVREVVDFSSEGLWPSAAMTRRHARFTQFAMAAADQALKDAGLGSEHPEEGVTSRTDATRPVTIAPGTIVRRSSAAWACCSSSSTLRRETIRLRPPLR